MVPLCINTEYSLLKSLIKIDDLISFLIKNNITACAICDEELFGCIEFYIKCKQNNIKPIIGLNIKINDLSIFLYAKNYDGYLKLLKINTKKFKNKIEIDDVIDENLMIVIPYNSLDLYGHFPKKENIYLGYTNSIEKQNVLYLSNNVVYYNVIKCLLENDLKYLAYLQKLGGIFDYNENSFFKVINDNDDNNRVDEFASKFNLEIPFDKRYIPVYKEGISSYVYLQKLCYIGLEKRIGKNNQKYIDRLNEELKVINEMGFVDYFLIVYDYVLYAKKNDILVGPGRGSAAGSLVSYLIGITDIDPLKYDLLFSRFLNIARKKMPDIDVDFEDTKREDVINYVREKHGKNNVALGLTFNTYKPKLILRDLAKIEGIDNNLIDKFVKLISSNISLKENLNNELVKKYLSMYPKLKKMYDVAMHLENLKKNTTTHASGVVISSKALDEIIPVYIDGDVLKTGIELDEKIEKLGLLKMDFLGLNHLSLIHRLLKATNLNMKDIPLDEKKVYNAFSLGLSSDIFQFDSNYAIRVLKQIKPQNFDELCITMALVRPGANNQIEDYLKNKNSFKVTNKLDEILKNTYGLIIYQEQVTKILEVIASYNIYEADLIRAAISKKNEDIINKEEVKFISGAVNNGYTKEFAQNLWNQIKRFGGYGFNKSHCVCYTYLSYVECYFKVNYPTYFAKEMLNNKGDEDKNKYFNFLKQNNVKILKPHINKSTNEFLFKNNLLLLPFNMIKTLKSDLISKIIETRQNSFIDIFDFFMKMGNFIDEKSFETLVLSGCLDCFNLNKQTLIKNFDVLKNYSEVGIDKPILKEYPEFDLDYIRECEKNYYGLYIGNHPCSVYQECIKINNLDKYLFKNVDMVLLVEKLTVIKTKKGEDMAFINASDETGNVELTVFPNMIQSISGIKSGDIIFVNGKYSKRFDKYHLIVNNISRKCKKDE